MGSLSDPRKKDLKRIDLILKGDLICFELVDEIYQFWECFPASNKAKVEKIVSKASALNRDVTKYPNFFSGNF